MEFDFKIRSRFVKRSMGRRRNNPISNYEHFLVHMREEMEYMRTFLAQKSPLRREPSRGGT